MAIYKQNCLQMLSNKRRWRGYLSIFIHCSGKPNIVWFILYSQQPYEMSIMILPILQTRKLAFGQVNRVHIYTQTG